jgi:hypothetical protein
VDYRRFLGRCESMVLPYLGGLSVHAADRRLRVSQRVAAGWWRFELRGREATPTENAEPIDMHDLPSVRGHLVGDWLFTAGTAVERVFLLPHEQEIFAPARARCWHGGDHLSDDFPFADEAELAAREAWFAGSSVLTGIKGVVPSLRAAFGFAAIRREAAHIGLDVSPREVLARAHEVASATRSPDSIIHELEARRFTIDPESDHRHRAFRRTRATEAATLENAEARVCAALEPTGAEVLGTRHMGDRSLEVVFRYLGERFISVVDWETLHVFDSGICLSGHDEQLGLDSLPSVIAEAIEDDALNITRR